MPSSGAEEGKKCKTSSEHLFVLENEELQKKRTDISTQQQQPRSQLEGVSSGPTEDNLSIKINKDDKRV